MKLRIKPDMLFLLLILQTGEVHHTRYYRSGYSATRPGCTRQARCRHSVHVHGAASPERLRFPKPGRREHQGRPWRAFDQIRLPFERPTPSACRYGRVRSIEAEVILKAFEELASEAQEKEARA
jgi:hypothetical protein